MVKQVSLSQNGQINSKHVSNRKKKKDASIREEVGKVTWEDIAQLKNPQMAYITSSWKNKI